MTILINLCTIVGAIIIGTISIGFSLCGFLKILEVLEDESE